MSNSGYKRPPEHSKFKPGQSGNPAGRPRARRKTGRDAFRDSIENLFTMTFAVIDNGKRKKLSLWEYAARKLLTTIARNDIAAKDLRDITRAFLELREWLDKDAAKKPNVMQVLRLVGADAKL